MDDRTTLLRIDITRDTNDAGEPAYLVTPLYRLPGGRVVTVPDTRGWPTQAEALADASRIARGY